MRDVVVCGDAVSSGREGRHTSPTVLMVSISPKYDEQ